MRRKLRMEDFAERIGISRSVLADIENLDPNKGLDRGSQGRTSVHRAPGFAVVTARLLRGVRGGWVPWHRFGDGLIQLLLERIFAADRSGHLRASRVPGSPLCRHSTLGLGRLHYHRARARCPRQTDQYLRRSGIGTRALHGNLAQQQLSHPEPPGGTSTGAAVRLPLRPGEKTGDRRFAGRLLCHAGKPRGLLRLIIPSTSRRQDTRVLRSVACGPGG